MTSGTTDDQALRARPRLAPLAPLTWEHQRRSGWSWLRLVVVVGWLVFGAGYAVTVEHPGSYDDLVSRVSAGDVQQVTVRGDAYDEAGGGRTTVEVAWRDGVLRRVATVLQVPPARLARGPVTPPSGTSVVSGKVITQLTGLQPGLDVTRAEQVHRSGWTIFGLPMTSWWRWVGLGLALATLWLLVSGPEPWRGTRWAWFWLMFLGSPVGLAAFLVLAGPPLSPRSHRRITGGWAFLLALLIGSVTQS
ncbi:hypothetical protein H5V45_18100 [Nocardioides sp. KIGAM211]|uniref:Uncharacterized protein n=1 Tax=Nocardioides luti TaxID=2761101 RepID=A0A7X0RJE3_9ACTN|nr:hypothetical protein [Nocardioides luti]MBB6629245.1 hypothetical protein [Nocardioides luti]